MLKILTGSLVHARQNCHRHDRLYGFLVLPLARPAELGALAGQLARNPELAGTKDRVHSEVQPATLAKTALIDWLQMAASHANCIRAAAKCAPDKRRK